MRIAVSGGAGFLGLHLVRRLRAAGHEVRTLDLVRLEPSHRADGVEELVGDVRSEADSTLLCAGADVLVHAAAALPIRASRRTIRSVNVDGTATLLAAARRSGVGRVVHISSTAVYGVPERHPIDEDDPLVGVGAYGESKVDAERLCAEFGRRGLDVLVVRPKTFLGPERLGVFEILFDWIREGRAIPILGPGANRYQLLAVEDLVEAILLSFAAPAARQAVNVGAASFGTVREDLERLIEHGGSRSTLRPVPARAAEAVLRGLELLRLSPLAEWHYRTAHRDSFVAIDRARQLLGWEPRLSNADTLCAAYDWYLEHRAALGPAGTTHRVPWDQRALGLARRLS